MRNVKNVIYFTLITLVFTSCDDDDLTNPNNHSQPTKLILADYFPDSTANYWIYDTYLIDTLGNERYIRTDSVTVQDTSINNKSYKFYESSTPGSLGFFNRKLLRDSLGYMVNEGGRIQFTLKAFDTILESDTFQYVGIMNARMRAESMPILTPIGNYYDVMNYELTFTYDSIRSPFVQPVRISDNIYALDIGLVFNTYFSASQPSRYERRLMRYSVK